MGTIITINIVILLLLIQLLLLYISGVTWKAKIYFLLGKEKGIEG